MEEPQPRASLPGIVAKSGIIPIGWSRRVVKVHPEADELGTENADGVADHAGIRTVVRHVKASDVPWVFDWGD